MLTSELLPPGRASSPPRGSLENSAIVSKTPNLSAVVTGGMPRIPLGPSVHQVRVPSPILRVAKPALSSIASSTVTASLLDVSNLEDESVNYELSDLSLSQPSPLLADRPLDSPTETPNKLFLLLPTSNNSTLITLDPNDADTESACRACPIC